MIVAITSTGNDLDSNVDSRFGRCSYFAIHDTESLLTEFIPNPNKESTEGAGPASVQFIASLGTAKIISGEFGSKVKSILERLNIQQVILRDSEKTISEVIESLNHKN
jgi:predicted Fe-Mo cluster-binding NifX family protein